MTTLLFGFPEDMWMEAVSRVRLLFSVQSASSFPLTTDLPLSYIYPRRTVSALTKFTVCVMQ